MAIKTVSLELDAYEILSRARRHPRESFSCVVRRAHWAGPQYTGAALLAYMRERSRLGTALTDASLQRLCLVDQRTSNCPAREIPPGADADAYLVDRSVLTEMELEIKARVEGPVLTFLGAKPVSVFRVSVITIGQFSAALAAPDETLGTQVLAHFELASLSPLIAERYAREIRRLSTCGRDTAPLESDHIWLGSTAAALQSPLITRYPHRYAGIAELPLLPF